VAARARQSWTDAEPRILRREVEAMNEHAPEMAWHDEVVGLDGKAGKGWEGLAPVWAGDRSKPKGVDGLLAGRQLRLKVVYREAFPTVPPMLFPVDPSPPLERRTQHYWHLNPNGSLCLMRGAEDWAQTDTAAALVRKASGWFIEYLLVEAGAIDGMTTSGIFKSTGIDPVLKTFA
jgi:hypothetical protein